jgi:hypothetical protein
VVGLGKTLMATAIARVFQEDDDSNTFIICPPKLEPMWKRHVQKYQITGRVLSLGKTIEELPNLPRYCLVVIDESHNLRNGDRRRYRPSLVTPINPSVSTKLCLTTRIAHQYDSEMPRRTQTTGRPLKRYGAAELFGWAVAALEPDELRRLSTTPNRDQLCPFKPDMEDCHKKGGVCSDPEPDQAAHRGTAWCGAAVERSSHSDGLR